MPASFRAIVARGTLAAALAATVWLGWSAYQSEPASSRDAGAAAPAKAPAAPVSAGAAAPAKASAAPAAASVSSAGAAAPAASSTRPLPPGTLGAIDVPREELIAGPTVQISGWAVDPAGIDRIELRIDQRALPARYGIARADVAEVRPGYPDSARAGFEITADLAPLSPERHQLTIVAVNRAGNEAVVGSRSLVPPEAMKVWQPLYAKAGGAVTPAFQLLLGSSGIARGGANELQAYYRGYESPTVGVGLRVPILYLRTTLGAQQDWLFDPDWDVDRRCGARRIADDSLASVLKYSIDHQLPVLFTLNGGIWADASCDVPGWDVNDHLEQDPANCQWNEHDRVERDDALKHLPGGSGSMSAPELGRSLTFNVHAAKNRAYKRRNLQAAGRIIATFAREHPRLFAGINLDPDTYLNPFFEEREWYDYNPGTLRQFREWLSGTGPYSHTGRRDRGVPDLSRYRRQRVLSLAEVNQLAGRSFKSWGEVDPPRVFVRTERPYWKDPWVHEWDVFRRHLVAMHYDELAHWLRAVQIPKDRIFSSQGFMAPIGDALPFAVKLTSPSTNYDSGGMSIEGSIPRDGHLGAILYGKSAVNDVPMDTSESLFATFRRMDPGWAVVEFNTADLRTPDVLPTYAMGYRALRNMFNNGARFASPMAWNGSNGVFAGQPGYVSYTAWRNTPLEEAMRDFAVSHAFLPLGARLWTFGSTRYADDDGWSAGAGTVMKLAPGQLELTGHRREAGVLSPAGLHLQRKDGGALIVEIGDGSKPESLSVAGEGGDGTWHMLAPTLRAAKLSRTSAGWVVPLRWPKGLAEVHRLRVRTVLAPDSVDLTLRHIALYPAILRRQGARAGRP